MQAPTPLLPPPPPTQTLDDPNAYGGRQLKVSDDPEVEARRAKARERQRKKRARDRSAMQGVPTTGAKMPATGELGPEEDAKRQKMREAARERQRKHRAAVKARRLAEMDNPMPMPPGAYYAPQAYPAYGLTDPEGRPLLSASAAFGAPPGTVFANTLLLSLACAPTLKINLMRTYNLTEEDLPSLENTLTAAFEHWNHTRYAAHPAYAAMLQNPPAPPPQPQREAQENQIPHGPDYRLDDAYARGLHKMDDDGQQGESAEQWHGQSQGENSYLLHSTVGPQSSNTRSDPIPRPPGDPRIPSPASPPTPEDEAARRAAAAQNGVPVAPRPGEPMEELVTMEEDDEAAKQAAASARAAQEEQARQWQALIEARMQAESHVRSLEAALSAQQVGHPIQVPIPVVNGPGGPIPHHPDEQHGVPPPPDQQQVIQGVPEEMAQQQGLQQA